ncbi:MAG: PaaI family thioesterase [Solirubrobacterales bacterium]
MNDEPQMLSEHFDTHIGLEHLDDGDGWASGRLEISDATRQPFGIVHGGVMAAIAESVVSAKTFREVADDGKIAVGQSNAANFLRPVEAGSLHIDARARHAGRTSWVWDVDITDDEDRLCATVRIVMAVRDRR